MKRPVLGLLWAAAAVCLWLYFAYQMWLGGSYAQWQMNAAGLCGTAFVGLFGFMLITGWGFKKGYRADVQCVSCYRFRMFPDGSNSLRCDNCGNSQADVPHLADRLQSTSPT